MKINYRVYRVKDNKTIAIYSNSDKAYYECLKLKDDGKEDYAWWYTNEDETQTPSS